MVSNRGRSILLRGSLPPMIQGNPFESASLKRAKCEPYILLLILASVLGHFIGGKNLRYRMYLGDLEMVLQGVSNVAGR